MSILYQHCSKCSEPIRSEQQYTLKPDAMHINCYIEKLLIRIDDLKKEQFTSVISCANEICEKCNQGVVPEYQADPSPQYWHGSKECLANKIWQKHRKAARINAEIPALGKHLSNIVNPEHKLAKRYHVCSTHAHGHVSLMELEWQAHLDWIATNVIGPPKATEKYTQEELEERGHIGIYKRVEE